MSRKRRKYASEMTYHYTYRITNTVEKKYYYGVHSCDCLPHEDIGVKYFSTSKNKSFKQDIKDNPQNYKYKVIKIFPTRVEALEHEIFLHAKFEVGKNPRFYNGSKQTSTRFDTSGTTPWNKGLESKYKGGPRSEETKQSISKNKKGVKQSEEHRLKNSESKKGMIYIHKNGKAKKVYPEKLDNFLNDGWVRGKLPMSEETKNKISESNKGNTVINNKVVQKVIKLIELEKYIQEGWIHGQLTRSKEHCEKLSKSIKGYKHTEETKQKMSVAHKNRQLAKSVK